MLALAVLKPRLPSSQRPLSDVAPGEFFLLMDGVQIGLGGGEGGSTNWPGDRAASLCMWPGSRGASLCRWPGDRGDSLCMWPGDRCASLCMCVCMCLGMHVCMQAYMHVCVFVGVWEGGG